MNSSYPDNHLANTTAESIIPHRIRTRVTLGPKTKNALSEKVFGEIKTNKDVERIGLYKGKWRTKGVV